jgi:hypothetical protein
MKALVWVGLLFWVLPLWAWNAEGHRVIAQIALDNMTPSAKARFQVAHPLLDKRDAPKSFTEAAVWFDKFHGVVGPMHYVDIAFSDKGYHGAPLPPKPLNAIMAFEQSRLFLLRGEGSSLGRVVALRILMHVVGDLHQPLHAATRMSRAHPEGDAGGNYVRLPRQAAAKNLHAYWDRGGGFLLGRSQVKQRAHVLEKMWPCHPEEVDLDSKQWVLESFSIAQEKVYHFTKASIMPGGTYQAMVYQLSEQRLAEAGCRLAAVLNEIDAYGSTLVA